MGGRQEREEKGGFNMRSEGHGFVSGRSENRRIIIIIVNNKREKKKVIAKFSLIYLFIYTCLYIVIEIESSGGEREGLMAAIREKKRGWPK